MESRLIHFFAACLGMFMFGVAVITLGAILPDIIQAFELSEVMAGLLGSLLGVGTLIGSLIAGIGVDRYGYKGMLVISTLLMLLGIEGIAFASEILHLQLSVILIGIGGGAINVGVNALVSDVWVGNRGAGLSALGVFYGVGALGLPLLLGLLSAYWDYTQILFGIGLSMIIPIIVYLWLIFPGPKQQKGVPFFKGMALIGKPVLFLLGAVLFFQGAIEALINTWVPLYMKEMISSTPTTEQAMLGLSVFVGALTTIRLGMGKLLKEMPAFVLLLAGFGVSAIGSLMMIGSHILSSAYFSLVFMGIGVGVVFPIVVGYIGDLFAGMSGTAISAVLIMALFGHILGNYLMGVLADSYGLYLFPWMVLICLGFQAGIFGWTRWRVFKP